MKPICIAIDAMGGDHGPSVTVPAALEVLSRHPDLHLILVGNSDVLRRELAKRRARETDVLSIRHASQQIAMDDAPAYALRKKKDSAMRIAINAVKAGEAQACVSAGNTGALMMTARFVLKTVPGIDRPAIVSSFPTHIPGKEVYVLDLGANVDSSAEHLYQFAVMGSVIASAVDNVEEPKVALLNIGEEDIKGNDQVKLAAQLLSDSETVNYSGYIEGDGLFSGDVDVVVCDGFIGNIVLKTIEGVVKIIVRFAIDAFQRNWISKLSAMVSRPVLKRLKRRIDPRRRNGATVIGLRGTVVKSHGRASAPDFGYAIELALLEIRKDIPRRIRRKLGQVLEDEEG